MGGRRSAFSSPPELGGVRGGLHSALPLATIGTQEESLFLCLSSLRISPEHVGSLTFAPSDSFHSHTMLRARISASPKQLLTNQITQ
jgi:hypothetical protein